MSVFFEKDESIRIHARGAIAQLCSPFRSHEQGLPELFKNASTAYANANSPTEDRVLTLFLGNQDGNQYIALLDHVGMTVEDIEKRFSDWGNPEAYVGAASSDEILEGGHGNGGKCYMTQMFESYSYIYTVRGGRGSKYGFMGDDPNPGYFPNRQKGRGFPVSEPVAELRRALSELGIDFVRLPIEVTTAAAHAIGFTLVVGVGARNFEHKDTAIKLVESTILHPQSQISFQRNRVFVLINGKPIPAYCPVKLPEIKPHPDAPEPRIIQIPRILIDPETENEVPTTRDDKSPQGHLVLRTSEVSMRYKLKSRHCITYYAYKYPIGAFWMEDIARSHWIERMYGECHLDELRQYETNDRSDLAKAPLTRAVRAWIKDQVLLYDSEFRKREQIKASHAQQEELRKQNEFLNNWIRQSLEEEASPTAGPDTGKVQKRTQPRPLPELTPASVEVSSEFQRAGVGVALRLRPTFRNSNGERVAAVPYLWYSSDWAVATVDSDINALVTHAPGVTSIWIETLDKKLRSNSIDIEVIGVKSITVDPPELTLPAGRIQQLKATVIDNDGRQFSDVYLTWLQDDSSIVAVTSTGKVIGRRQGVTGVHACDDNYVEESSQCLVTVIPGDEASGQKGRQFPKILLSEIDPDPLHPDREPCHLAPEDGPVHQPTPQHVENNIWFINMTCPLAKHYFEKYGPESREWRIYHLERFVEALVKIKLSHFYQENEGISFDEMERRWREQAAEVQTRAIGELSAFLQGETITYNSI